MEGVRHFRNRGNSSHAARIRRGVALLCAVAALFGALLVCLSPAGGGVGPGAGEAHAASTATPTPTPASSPSPAYNCPYDQGSCGAFPHSSPAVLTAPPPDTLPGAVALPVRHEGDGGTARVPHGDAAGARTPGPYVLMVLRR